MALGAVGALTIKLVTVSSDYLRPHQRGGPGHGIPGQRNAQAGKLLSLAFMLLNVHGGGMTY